MGNDTEIDVQAIFQEEATARLAALGDLVLKLEQDGPTPDVVSSMFREAHTIKGAAAVVGLEAVAREAHVLEELLSRIRAGEWEVTPEVIDTILSSVDQLSSMTMAPPEPTKPAAPPQPPAAKATSSLASRLAPKRPDLADFADADAEADDEDDGREGAGPNLGNRAIQIDNEPGAAAKRGQAQIGAAARQSTARVAVERLDDLVRVADEAAGANLRLAGILAERLGDDPTVSTEVRILTNLLAELHDKTLRTRMVAVGTISGQLRRAVRDMSRITGKQVSLEIRGEDTELDRSVHEKLGDALVHLVRNAVDHGIEAPDVPRRGRQAGRRAQSSSTPCSWAPASSST